MASTITTTNAAFNGSRLSAFDSTGRLWTAIYDGANTRWGFWYSDNGTSFTEATSLRITASGLTHGALDIDTTNDRAVFAHASGVGSSTLRAVTGITSSSSWTTLSTSSVTAYNAYGELVTFAKPSSSNYYVIVHGLLYSTNYSSVVTAHEYTSAHSLVTETTIASYIHMGPTAGWATVDFRHTGDGSTVASSSPDIYAAWVQDNTDVVYFQRMAWTGSGWTAGTVRNMGSANGTSGNNLLSASFDGSRYCMAWVNNASSSAIDVVERDAGDTATTTRTIPALSGGAVQGLGVSYDGAGDMIVHASGATADDIHRTQFVRVTGIWDSWSTIDTTTTVSGQPFSQSKGWASGKGIAVVWRLASNNVDTITDFVNTAPSAPLWTSPGDNLAQDRGAALTLDWAFTDVDAGDTQSAYKIKRSVNGGGAQWWTGAAWGAETKITSTTTALAMASGWATDGDSVVYNVLTYDAADVVGPYSDDLTVIASVPDNPTMTAPATSATITVAQPTVSWTVAEQSAYQVDVYETDDSLLYSTGKITSTSTSITLGYTLDNGLTDLKFKITTWNADDLVCSTPDTNTLIDVTYTVPLTPVLTVTANDAGGYISVAIADPTPSSTPTVLYHDVYVRVASGGRQDGERTVNDNGIRISTGTVPEDGTYLDYAAASGVNYQYRTQAFGDNGAVVHSAWT